MVIPSCPVSAGKYWDQDLAYFHNEVEEMLLREPQLDGTSLYTSVIYRDTQNSLRMLLSSLSLPTSQGKEKGKLRQKIIC